MADGPVLITGVSGYIACHVAKLLLEDGYQVRGTVRSLTNEERVAPLKALVPEAKHPLELVEADLTKEDGWDKAVEGCSAIMHMASPFPDAFQKTVSEEELLGPAKDGTLIVLKAAAAHTNTVKRVVLTSSFVSVHGETTFDPEKLYNEEDWTDTETDLDPYTKSKVVAEKAAWDYLKELSDEQKFELCVINPSFVLGPPLMESHKSSTSVSYMNQIVTRSMPAVPKLCFPYCDVRDVAKAHIKALQCSEAVNNRHIISSGSFWFRDIAQVAAKEFKEQGYNIPTAQVPNLLIRAASLFNKNYRANIVPRLSKVMKADNKRMTEALGIEPTPIESTVQDMIYAMVDLGIAPKGKKYKQVGSRAEVPAVNGEAEDKKNEEEVKDDEKKELEPEDKDKEVKIEDLEEPTKEEKEKEESKEEKEKEEEKKEADNTEAEK